MFEGPAETKATKKLAKPRNAKQRNDVTAGRSATRAGSNQIRLGPMTISTDAPSSTIRKRNVKKGQRALARARSKLVKPGITIKVAKGVPLFRADTQEPTIVVRVLNGKRTRGRFVKGKFRAIR